MIDVLNPNQSFFRVTKVGFGWKDVLSGEGALFLDQEGNRYNVVLQRAVYVSADLKVAVTEFAYYSARDWHHRIGNHYLVPVPMPLHDDFLLWQFTLREPKYVIDIESAPTLSLHLPHFVLLNPGRNYMSTQQLAIRAVTQSLAGYSPPHPGLKVPAVRSRHGVGSESNYVFYRTNYNPRGRLVGRWKLRIEFLDIQGNPVQVGTHRIDWAHPRFQLLPLPRTRKITPPPTPYKLGTWYPVHINHL